MIVRLTDLEDSIEVPPGRDPWGLHGKDEVWDGIYKIMPDPNDEHQEIVTELGAALVFLIKLPGLGLVRIGGNTSDRDQGWTKNFRIPDLSIFLNNTRAINLGSHWQGGPDFAVEILSDDDHAREKIPFYAQNGVQELLIVDRDPWALELYRQVDGNLSMAGRSTLDSPEILSSELFPLSIQLNPGEPRPRIDLISRHGIERWSV